MEAVVEVASLTVVVWNPTDSATKFVLVLRRKLREKDGADLGGGQSRFSYSYDFFTPFVVN